MKVRLILFIAISIFLNQSLMAQQSEKNKLIVRAFLETVRSGKSPDDAKQYMADSILAHQLNVENETTVKRTPENYASHIKDFLKMYGQFSFEITEILADGDKVYARWIQKGKHISEIDGYLPTENQSMKLQVLSIDFKTVK